jgi:hypothetical protein
MMKCSKIQVNNSRAEEMISRFEVLLTNLSNMINEMNITNKYSLNILYRVNTNKI